MSSSSRIVPRDSRAWQLQVWVSFGIAVFLCVVGLAWLPGEPLMSRDNVDSMRVPNVASGRLPGLADLGIQATALEAVAPGYLGQGFNRGRYNRWRTGAGTIESQLGPPLNWLACASLARCL